jgi:riboflavin biosynthesis pyrimidine reductase
MRALLPVQDPEVDLHRFYAEGWLDEGGVRADFVASADGAVSVDGRARGLQSPGDNRVFAALRDLADVVVVGAGTARVEGYRSLRVKEQRAAIRREFGLAQTLPLAVISRSLELDPASTLFADEPDASRTILLTCEAAPAQRRAVLGEVADVLVCGAETVDLAVARRALEARGHTRILTEGGPHTLAEFVQRQLLDELCLSITPCLVGPGPKRIVQGSAAWDAAYPMRLTGLLEDDSSLFLRYRRA